MAEKTDLVAQYCLIGPSLQVRAIVNQDSWKNNRAFDIPVSYDPKDLPDTFSDTSFVTREQLYQELSLPTHYIKQDLYRGLTSLKDQLEPLAKVKGQLEDLRALANPYEIIGVGQYGNRAASKLASINAIFDLFPRDQVISVVDLAGGPGSWSQYVLTNYPQATIIGITLHREGSTTNWNFKKYGLTSARFEEFRGKISATGKGDGDLLQYYNDFSSYVLTKGSADVVMADGGEEGSNENLQEQYNVPLILAEIVTGLLVVKKMTDRPGGNMVIKVFDLHTNLMAQIIHLVSKCFNRCILTKPITSRPANSEKYLVCLGCHSNDFVKPYADYLSQILGGIVHGGRIPHQIAVIKYTAFSNWLYNFNEIFGIDQYNALEKILEVKRNPQQAESIYDLSLYMKIIGWRDTDDEIYG